MCLQKPQFTFKSSLQAQSCLKVEYSSCFKVVCAAVTSACSSLYEKVKPGSSETEKVQLCTLHRYVNLCLSTEGLPLLAGYSKSRSRPSKPRALRKWIDVSMKSLRLAAEASMADILTTPKFQPPTASMVFKLGLLSFSAWNSTILYIHSSNMILDVFRKGKAVAMASYYKQSLSWEQLFFILDFCLCYQ